MILTRDYGVEVKMSLVGMFGEAKLGTKIKGTDIDSTGSAKCDAYMWAIEKYMEETNPELAYTPTVRLRLPPTGLPSAAMRVLQELQEYRTTTIL